MKSIFDPAARAELLARFDRIPRDAAPKWGKMNAPRMLCHVSDSLRVALGDKQVAVKKSFLSNRLMRWLLIYALPWPKGAPTSPEMLTTSPAEWEEDRRALRELVERVGARGPDAPWPPHPAFGGLSGRQYGHLMHRHLDHHLRQFGV